LRLRSSRRIRVSLCLRRRSSGICIRLCLSRSRRIRVSLCLRSSRISVGLCLRRSSGIRIRLSCSSRRSIRVSLCLRCRSSFRLSLRRRSSNHLINGLGLSRKITGVAGCICRGFAQHCTVRCNHAAILGQLLGKQRVGLGQRHRKCGCTGQKPSHR
jgi:hypothetical protein